MKYKLNFSLDIVDSGFINTENNILRLKEVFSQPENSKLFGDKKIDLENYINWAIKQSDLGQYYLFLVRDNQNNILGGIDIQKVTNSQASIGFWKDKDSTFSMTNAILDLEKVCKNLGFSELDSYTEPDNEKAINLLIRCNFKDEGIVEGKTKKLVKFTKNLLT